MLVIALAAAFPERLSELHVDAALQALVEWRVKSGDSRAVNEKAFRANHAFVNRRNRRASATYKLELNDLFADHPFPDEKEVDEEEEVRVPSKSAFLPQGFLDWRKKNAVGPVKVFCVASAHSCFVTHHASDLSESRAV